MLLIYDLFSIVDGHRACLWFVFMIYDAGLYNLFVDEGGFARRASARGILEINLVQTKAFSVIKILIKPLKDKITHIEYRQHLKLTKKVL